MIHRVKAFGIVNEAEVDVLLKFSCVFYGPMTVGNLISGSFAFSKSSLYIWKFLVHILLKSSLKDFEHYLASLWKEHSCVVVWAFFGIAFLWDWNENWPLPVPWPLLSFPICWHTVVLILAQAKPIPSLKFQCFLSKSSQKEKSYQSF